MKSVFLSIVTLITCSASVIGDLEFYPDYKRSEAEVSEEEWIKEPPMNSDLQRYLQEVSALYQQDRERSSYPYGGLRRGKTNKEVDQSWPSTIARHLFNNKELALKLLHRNEKPQEPSRKQQYFKILPSGRDPKARLNRLLEDKDASALLSLFKPSYQSSKDRLQQDPEGSDFNFSDDDDDIVEEDASERIIDSNESAHRDEERRDSDLYNVDNELNPDEFAYLPSDPRYFRDSEQLDIKPPQPKTLKNDDIHNDMQSYVNKQEEFEEVMDPKSKHTEEGTGDVVTQKSSAVDDSAGMYVIAVVAGISAAATVGLIAFGIGWYNLQKHVKNASDVDYPAYGITGPNKDISPSGDRRLAQSAQMYHYQHQKQQIIAMERAAANERHGSVSEAESDEENEEGDYTVYECPGLAPTGEMEVKNPLFQDDPTPAQTPAVKLSDNGVSKK